MGELERSTPAEIYERYLGRSIADPFTRVLLEYAEPKRGERLLDLASGTGSVARHAAPMVESEGRVVAVDISPSMLAAGKAVPAPGGAQIEWLEGDAVSLDLSDGAFDLVLCQQGLQFFSDRMAALQEMNRVLAPGGRVVISVWQALSCHPVYEKLFESTSRHLGVPIAAVAVSFSLGDAEELRRLLRNAQFQSIEIVPRSLDVHLPSPGLFVEFTVKGAATSIPAFARLDSSAQSALVTAISGEVEPVIQEYRKGDELIFPLHTHIGIAR